MSVLLLNLEFTDFMLLAIIHAIMLGISTIEASATNLDEAAENNHRLAGTTAFVGLLLSVLLGFTVESTSVVSSLLGGLDASFVTPSSLLIPLGTVAFWFKYHRRASSLVSVSDFRRLIDKELDREIVIVVTKAGRDGLTDDQIMEQLRARGNDARDICELDILHTGPLLRMAERAVLLSENSIANRDRILTRLEHLVTKKTLYRDIEFNRYCIRSKKRAFLRRLKEVQERQLPNL